MTLLAAGAVSHAQDAPKADAAPKTDATPKSEPRVADPDFNPAGLWDGRKMVPFRALDFPKMVAAKNADFLTPNDYVLGVTVNGESRAYPTRFLWWHHVINDRVEKPGEATYFFVTYCSVCNSGLRYDPTVNGNPLKIDFYGLYNGVVALCDRETGSPLLQISGKFVTGPLAGQELKRGPVLDTTWKHWQKLHPDTLVMSPDTPYQRFYSPKEQPEPRGYDKFPAPFFRPTVTRGDRRLPPFDKVLAVALPQPAATGSATGTTLFRAYPMATLQQAGVIDDTLGDTPVAVFLEPESQTANAVSRRLDDRTLTFEARKQAGGASAIYDRETGTRWNVEGRAEAGKLAGKTLTRLDNHLSQWYGWVAYFPETTIYGHSEAPQPGNPFASPETPAKSVAEADKKPKK